MVQDPSYSQIPHKGSEGSLAPAAPVLFFIWVLMELWYAECESDKNGNCWIPNKLLSTRISPLIVSAASQPGDAHAAGASAPKSVLNKIISDSRLP
jgi:hypothetical protein